MGVLKEFWKILKEYLHNSSFHGAKFLINDEYTLMEKYLMINLHLSRFHKQILHQTLLVDLRDNLLDNFGIPH